LKWGSRLPDRPPIPFASVAATDTAHRPVIALNGDGPASLTGTHFALAKSRPIIATATFAVARTIRLADLDADARNSDSDALGMRWRGGVESDRGRSAQQDQQSFHGFFRFPCREGTSREEQWFRRQKLYSKVTPN
jgi:hypothetical protein